MSSTLKHPGIALLNTIGTHDFLSVEEGEALCAAFAVPAPKPQSEWANTKNPKGLFTPDGVRRKVRGYSAYILVMRICDALGVTYAPMLGRGSQFRACEEALARHVGG